MANKEEEQLEKSFWSLKKSPTVIVFGRYQTYFQAQHSKAGS